MITTYEIGYTVPEAPGPNERPLAGPTDVRDPGGRAFVGAWLGHVAAGRVGNPQPVNEAARATVLANERVLCGRQRSLLG